jgi:regulator of sirC expression with transglutaminase-like and TPR domain
VLDDGQVIYLDPFHRGTLMTEGDCRDRVDTVTGGRLPFHEAFLNPVGVRYILGRMLNNLKNTYAAAGDHGRAAEVVERLLILHPNDPDEIRNLGLLYGALGRRRQAASYLEQYLAQRPDAPDAAAVTQFLATLSSQAARWN